MKKPAYCIPENGIFSRRRIFADLLQKHEDKSLPFLIFAVLYTNEN